MLGGGPVRIPKVLCVCNNENHLPFAHTCALWHCLSVRPSDPERRGPTATHRPPPANSQDSRLATLPWREPTEELCAQPRTYCTQCGTSLAAVSIRFCTACGHPCAPFAPPAPPSGGAGGLLVAIVAVSRRCGQPLPHKKQGRLKLPQTTESVT